MARLAFPKGNLYLQWRDELKLVYRDEDFADLYSHTGQPALCPWRLAVVTVMQFVENLSDRQAAEAVRSRIDWKYVLGLKLTDAGFDHSVLCEFRERLVAGDVQTLLLDRLLNHLKGKNLLKVRGRQRTDSTHVLASIRVMNRLELITETMRAALNELATVDPDWLRHLAPLEWYGRYQLRAEQSRLPQSDKARQEYAQTVGHDGVTLMWAVEAQRPQWLSLDSLVILRQVWQRHFERGSGPSPLPDSLLGPGEVALKLRPESELPRAATAIESPYETQARFSCKRELRWTGYKAHLSETCDDLLPRLITHVHTTCATTQDVSCTQAIHQALAAKDLLPHRHLVDTGYVDAHLLVQSQEQHGVELFGPTRLGSSWQSREGGYDQSHFSIEWEHKRARCPQGHVSRWWHPLAPQDEVPSRIKITFAALNCSPCPDRARCVRSKTGQARGQARGRGLIVPSRAEYEALQHARTQLTTQEGKRVYQQRAGIEGTLSQAVRRSGLRQARYRGLAKTHLQHVATAVALNLVRTLNHLQNKPLAQTRRSRFARLAT